MSATVRPCTKRPFPNYSLAMRRLVEIALLEPEANWSIGKPVDAYYCRRCTAWHLTRRSQ